MACNADLYCRRNCLSRQRHQRMGRNYLAIATGDVATAGQTPPPAHVITVYIARITRRVFPRNRSSANEVKRIWHLERTLSEAAVEIALLIPDSRDDSVARLRDLAAFFGLESLDRGM
jgi:hypothetical protein